MDAAELAFIRSRPQAGLVRAVSQRRASWSRPTSSASTGWTPQLNAFRSGYRDGALAEADRGGAPGGRHERPLLGVPVAIRTTPTYAGDVTSTERMHTATPRARRRGRQARARRRRDRAGKTQSPLCALPCTESPTWGITRTRGTSTARRALERGSARRRRGLVGAALGTDRRGLDPLSRSSQRSVRLKPQRGRISLAPLAEHWPG